MSLQTDWKEDYFLPDGWKTCWFRLAEKSKFRKFMSPSGRIYQARSSAIKEMIVNNHPEKDIEIMRKGLFSDGWVEMKDLPQGWLKFTSGNGVTKFLSPEFHAISSKPKEIEHNPTCNREKGKYKTIKERLRSLPHVINEEP